MKVTICFDDVKIIVPCGTSSSNNDDENNNLKVIDIIENAILRYRKATSKVTNYYLHYWLHFDLIITNHARHCMCKLKEIKSINSKLNISKSVSNTIDILIVRLKFHLDKKFFSLSYLSINCN